MLKITTEMVIDLADLADNKDAKIALTSEGWSVEVDTVGAYPDGLTAMTAFSLASYSDGHEVDEDTAAGLAAGLDYSIPTETGAPADAGDWQVVTPADIDPDDPAPAWEGAWAFNLDTARCVVAEQPWAYWEGNRAEERRKVTSLYLTEAGTWVMLTRSQWASQPDTWTELTAAEAIEYAYQAEGDLIMDDPPTIIKAGRLAAELAGLVTAPTTPVAVDIDEASANAWQQREAAAAAVHDGAVIADLIYSRVTADIKRQRARAAQVAVTAYVTQTAAAEALGMKQPRLNKLLRYDA